MAKADLHVHSKFSNHPSEWFLKRIGASESYTDPEYIYRKAKQHGMQFVTITDHNTIEGSLMMQERHPEDFFVGVESTAYFPENNCKIHILNYGINTAQFSEIEHLRTNIYELRDYLRDTKIAHSVAHATYSINGKLTIEHLEKLILLFDVFEGINGARSKLNNEPWQAALNNLTRDHIAKLYDRHGIEPISDTPWIKGFTGGSDDHAGLFNALTYTHAEAQTTHDFIKNIRNKQSICDGRVSNYQCLAFAIYKIAYEFSKTKSGAFSQSLFSQLTENLFGTESRNLKSLLKIKTYKTFKGKNGNTPLQDLYWDLFEDINRTRDLPIEDKLDGFYDRLGLISDEFFKILLGSFEKSLKKGDIAGLLKNVSTSLPGIFLTVPFFSTLKHFYQAKNITGDLTVKLGIDAGRKTKRILWFSDTLTYMNGVSMTVKKIGWLSYLKGKDVNLVVSLPESEISDEFPPNIINIPHVFEFSLPYYEHYLLRVPSFLRSIKQLYTYEPDEIYISTPGPMGLFGLLVARILNAKPVCVFHTDFTWQARDIVDDSSVEGLIENYLKWFNSLCDEVHVPSGEYISILEGRGYETSKMKLFRRGIDIHQFQPRPDGKKKLASKYGIEDGITLMYAGRISKDKNIDFLFDVYNKISENHPPLNLVIAGHGPDLERLKKAYGKNKRVVFTGRLTQDDLPELYSGSNMFVFPSTTDTFGMVVLEAQACGLPALVTDVGGPKEIIVNENTGYVAKESHIDEWCEKISYIIQMIEHRPDEYIQLRDNCRNHVCEKYDWNKVLEALTEWVPSETETILEETEYENREISRRLRQQNTAAVSEKHRITADEHSSAFK